LGVVKTIKANMKYRMYLARNQDNDYHKLIIIQMFTQKKKIPPNEHESIFG